MENIGVVIRKGLLNQDKLPLYNVLKEEYNKTKTIYSTFLMDYMKFAKNVNKDLSQKPAREYFGLPNNL